MKKTIYFLAVLFISLASFSQKKITTSAVITFDATTSLDNLPKAENKTAVASLDIQKGTVQFEATIKNFSFSNPRIQEHFNNSNWMNSDEYPLTTFDGVIANLKDILFEKDGTYTATVEGNLTIRGVTQKITSNATIEIKNKSIHATGSFTIKLSDYKIDGPAIGSGKVAREPMITVTADFD